MDYRRHAPHAQAQPVAGRYRVLAYGYGGSLGWSLCGCYGELIDAQIGAEEAKVICSLVAVVDVRQTAPTDVPRLKVVEASVPNPARLSNSPDFCRVATAL
jgi:hypothetical protein